MAAKTLSLHTKAGEILCPRSDGTAKGDFGADLRRKYSLRPPLNEENGWFFLSVQCTQPIHQTFESAFGAFRRSSVRESHPVRAKG